MTLLPAGETRTLHLLPSTHATLADAAGRLHDPDWCVIGLADAFAMAGQDATGPESPAGFLAACRERPACDRPRQTIVFTDQFVSAEHAPLRATLGDGEQFIPTLELVAAAQYGFRIACWHPEGYRVVEAFPAGDQAALLTALAGYYQACDGLGEAWLMRARQHQRSLAGRVEAARSRLRYYQSVVMLADVDAAAAGSRMEVLKALVDLQQQLPRSVAP
ncbi:hypothetical protein [Arenimonas sp.]|uniref:hypothetical protein n=1 Tax=Arenimonas sp. TaxID=1872635 RepID=UPI0035B1619D